MRGHIALLYTHSVMNLGVQVSILSCPPDQNKSLTVCDHLKIRLRYLYGIKYFN